MHIAYLFTNLPYLAPYSSFLTRMVIGHYRSGGRDSKYGEHVISVFMGNKRERYGDGVIMRMRMRM